MYSLGFMQGRLSPIVGGKIQAFPVQHWRDEFELAQANGWEIMEWTIDQDKFEDNPVMTEGGRQGVHELMRSCRLSIPSATADFVMQAPFYKAVDTEYDRLLDQLRRFLINAVTIGIRHIVVPLVDNGHISSQEEELKLRKGLVQLEEVLLANRQTIVFESDFPPKQLYRFISRFPRSLYGINYDTGNSSSLGFDVQEEFEAYGQYIENIHIKDRIYQGTTVPLGEGDTDFKRFFEQLIKLNYKGNLIFQTARAEDDNHVEVLNHYRDYIEQVIVK